MLRQMLLYVGMLSISGAALAQQADSSNSAGLDSLLGPQTAQSSQQSAAQSRSLTSDDTPASSASAASDAKQAGVGSAPASETDVKPTAAAAKPAATGSRQPNAAVTRRATKYPVAKNRILEEIVVTAEKREENLQDVPISVQAFNGAQLAAKGIENPKQLTLSVPGLEYNNLAGYSIIFIRGVGSDAFIPSADPDVATYIDGIDYPFGHGLASALGNVKRVEVLKGPQGTLFGRNSSGGAINIITEAPSQTFRASGELEGGNFAKLNERLFVNVPILDSLAVSLSGLNYESDSYYKQAPGTGPVGGYPYPREDSRAFTAKVRWTPFDDLDALFDYTYINTRGKQAIFFPARNLKPAGIATGVKQYPDYEYGGTSPTYEDDTSRVFSTDIKYHLPWVNLRFLGSYQSIRAPALVDFDGSPQPLAGFEAIGQFERVRTAEFQLISNQSTPSWLKWVGGVYYLNSSAGYDPLHLFVGQGALDYLQQPGGLGGVAPLFTGLTNALSGAGLGSLTDYIDNGVTLSLRGIIDTSSISGYVQSTADITDWLSLTLGGRYQSERRSLVRSTTSLATNADSTDPSTEIQLLDFGTRSATAVNFSPRAVLDVKFNAQQHAYISFSRGFKSGTYNIIDVYEATQYIPPEEVTAYEVGYKATFFDGTLRLNTAIFQNNIRNLQVQTIALTSGGAARFETAGGARIQGGEFDLTWQPLPESLPGLAITSAGTYLRGRYTRYVDGSGFDNTTGLFFGGSGALVGGGVLPGRNFTGNTTVRTPTFTGTFSPSYAFDLGPGEMEFAMDYYYNSGFFFSAQNVDRAAQSDYGVIGARLSYLYRPWNIRLTAYGTNITGTKYFDGFEEFDFADAALLAPPAEYGLRLNWNFSM